MNRTQQLTRHVQQMARRAARPPVLLAMVLLVAAILFLLMIPAIQVGTWGDDATYVTMARSLVQGKGLSLVYLPADPVYPVVPIGYPLTLAPLVFLFPHSFLPLQLLSSAFLLITVVLVYLWARPRLGDRLAVFVAALFGTNVAIVQSAAQVMSEALFLLCVMWAAHQAERFVRSQAVRWHQVLLTAAVIGLPVSVRYLGLPIVAALMMYILRRRRDRFAVVAVALGVAILLIVNLGLGGLEVARYYIETISALLSRLNALVTTAPTNTIASSESAGTSFLTQLVNNARFLLTNPIPWSVVPLFHGPRVQTFFARMGLGFIPLSLQLGIDLLLVMGFIRQARGKSHVSEWIVLAYAATLFFFPTNWEETPSRFHYWIPLIPFGYIYLIAALRSVHEFIAEEMHLPGRLAHPDGLAAVAIACMLALNLGRDVQESIVNPLRDRVPDLRVGSEWLKAHSKADDVIMVSTPRAFALYLDREVVGYPPGGWEITALYQDLPEWRQDANSAEALLAIVDAFGVDYILISPARVPDEPAHWSRYVKDVLLPAIRSRPDRFLLVWASDDGFTEVYQVQQGSQ